MWRVVEAVYEAAKKLGIVILFLPIILVILWATNEILGMCINHIATQKQIHTLQMHLESEISDIEIISIYSGTGNTGI